MKDIGLSQIGSILILFCVTSNVNSYSKYGRGCADIGCLPTEVCTMAQDSCNFGQRDGKECGTYPTCKRNAGGGSTNLNAHARPSGSSLNPGPDNTFFSQPSSNPTLNTFNTNNNNNNNNQQQQNINSNQISNNNPSPSTNHVNNNNNNNNNHNQYEKNGNIIFGSPQLQTPLMDFNLPIFPYHQPTSAPSFVQFPQPQHPASVPQVPNNQLPGGSAGQYPFQPPAPYNIFGNQPSYNYNPQATTREPSLFEHLLHNDRQRHHAHSAGRAKDLSWILLAISIGSIVSIIIHGTSHGMFIMNGAFRRNS